MTVNSNNVVINYLQEPSFGSTPVNSNEWKQLRYSSESLNTDLTFVESSTIERDRILRDVITSSIQVSGSINSDFSIGIYDTFIQSAFCNEWNGDNLDIGYLYKSFTFEKQFLDIDKFSYFKGVRVDSFTLNIVNNDKLTCSFSLLGKEGDVSVQSLVGSGSVDEYPYAPIITANSVGALVIDEESVETLITELSFTVNNNLRKRGCLGSLSPTDIFLGEADVTGSMSLYLSSKAWQLYSKVLSQDDVSLTYQIQDADNVLLLNFPRLRVNSPTPSITGKDQDVYVTFQFKALRDNALGTSVRLTKRYGYSDGVVDWYTFYFQPYSGIAY